MSEATKSDHRPLVAYRKREVDPGLCKNPADSEERARLLRPVVRKIQTRPGFQDLLTAGAAACVANSLSPAAARKASDVVRSLTCSESGLRTVVALLQPTVRTMSAREADRLSEMERARCIPLRGSREVAVPGRAPHKPKSVVVVEWPSLADRRPPTLCVERSGETSVAISATNGSGGAARALGSADGVPKLLLDRLFAPAETRAACPDPWRRLPASPSELPDCLQMGLALFAQHKLRLHALVTAAMDTSSRPLAFDNMKLYHCSSRRKRDHVCVKAWLHSACCTCVCAGHNRNPPDPGQHSEVMLTFSMCGQLLPRADSGYGPCPLHQASTEKNHTVPGVCCANCEVSLACRHRIDGRPVARLVLDPQPLDPAAWEEVTALLSLAVDFERRAAEFVAAGPERLGLELATLESRADRALKELSNRAQDNGTALSMQTLVRNDMACIDTLRNGGVMQNDPMHKKRKLVSKDGSPLCKLQKEMQHTHFWLFPRHGRAAPVRASLPSAPSAPSLSALGSSSEDDERAAAGQAGEREERHAEGYDYTRMVEYIDPEGFAELQRQLEALLASGELSENERQRGAFMQRVIGEIERTYGAPTEVAGHTLRPLELEYRQRHGGGREYAVNVAIIEDPWALLPKAVCLQAMYAELRPFLCGVYAHDIDQSSSQPTIVDRTMELLTWEDGRAPPARPQLQRWIADRAGFIMDIAERHYIEDRYEDERKNMVKGLVIRLLFGGSYRAWVEQDLKREWDFEPKLRSVQDLERELEQIREAIFASNEWRDWCAADAARLREEGKPEHKIQRSVIARWAQLNESYVLAAMRAYLEESGWTVVSLVFDGLIVFDRPGHELDLRAMEARILQDTRVDMKIAEKPLFRPPGAPFPTLSLKRFS